MSKITVVSLSIVVVCVFVGALICTVAAAPTTNDHAASNSSDTHSSEKHGVDPHGAPSHGADPHDSNGHGADTREDFDDDDEPHDHEGRLDSVEAPEEHGGHDVHGGGDEHGGGHGNDSHGGHAAHAHHGIHVATVDFDYVKQPLIVSIFLIAVVLCKIGFHKANILSSWMPESCLLIALGTLVGVVLHFSGIDSFWKKMSPQMFYLYLQPPYILEAAYSLHDDAFFHNIGTILVYAILGTGLNCFIIGPALYGLAICGAMGTISVSLVQCFVFSSLIVAVEPSTVFANCFNLSYAFVTYFKCWVIIRNVLEIFRETGVNNVVYFIFLGESLFNDTVTIVLYKIMTAFCRMPGIIPVSEIFMGVASLFTILICGTVIGFVFGCLSGVLTRFTSHIKVAEPLAIYALAYCSYLVAELFHFSGMCSMIACCLMQREYAYHNISHNSVITVKYFTTMLSGACECLVFMFLGMSLVRDNHVWNTGFVLWALFLCLLTRFTDIFGLTFIVNKLYRTRQIDVHEQFIMAYGGLRGFVTICLLSMLTTDTVPEEIKSMFETATLFIIIFGAFVQGMTVKPIVEWLKIRGRKGKVLSMFQEISYQSTEHIMVFMEELIGHVGLNTFKEKVYNFDQKYLRKILQKDPVTRDEEIVGMYKEILEHEKHDEEHHGSKSSVASSNVVEVVPTYGHSAHGHGGEEPHNEKHEMEHASVKKPHHTTSHKFGVAVRSLIAAKKMSAPTSPSTTAPPSFRRGYSVHASERSSERRPRNFSESSGSKLGSQTSVLPDDFNVNDLKKLLVKPANSDIYQRRDDRNLKNGDQTDIVFRLIEMQQRRERHARDPNVRSPSSTPFSPRSRASSIDANDNDGELSPAPEVATAPIAIKSKPKFADLVGSIGQASYTPRYQKHTPNAANRLSDPIEINETTALTIGNKHELPFMDEDTRV